MEKWKLFLSFHTCEAWASRSIFSWMERDDNLCRELLKQHRRHLIHFTAAETEQLTINVETHSLSLKRGLLFLLLVGALWVRTSRKHSWVHPYGIESGLKWSNLSLLALPCWIRRSSLLSAHWHCGSDWMFIVGADFCWTTVYRSWNKQCHYVNIYKTISNNFTFNNILMFISTYTNTL